MFLPVGNPNWGPAYALRSKCQVRRSYSPKMFKSCHVVFKSCHGGPIFWTFICEKPWRARGTLLGLRPSSEYGRAITTQTMDTHSQEPVIRGYDPDSMQVQEIQLAAPSSANLSPHYEEVLREMRRHRTGVRTPPTAGAALTTTSDAAGTISSLSGGGPSKNIGAPRYSPRMDADEYVVIIKPRETCNLTQYGGTGSIGNAIRAAVSQRSDNAEADPNLAHKYSLHPIWEQNLVVVGTKEERVLPILLGLDKLRLTDRTINVQAYLKATDNMGKGVIRLANTFTTDYILENTTSPHNQIIGARRLGSTNVVALTFEHSNLPRCVFFLNEATLVQKYRKTKAICATCGKPGHRTDVCPAPVPENERCALCGKTGVDASQPHECHPRRVLCGGPHVAGSRDCPRRYRQPAPSKSANPSAGQTRGRSGTPTRHHNRQRDISSVAGRETRERSTSRSRSGNRLSSTPGRARRHPRHGSSSLRDLRRRIAISQEVKSATSHTQYCNRLRPIVKRVSGNSCCGYQGTREFGGNEMPPPENFYTGAPPIPPQHNFSLTRTILSPFFHILRSYNTSG
ncbi:hypothetical protein HPB49_013058 [Dermacentor silvarum]|uniref:Uncharacterized protein n=1 Tax=Dermacentor silvarum TaxID=543639 RepID=A0ACB8CXH2_DERSI|nr:hypothetical protein HPB49_013058 [Dermacentor silvarum]